MVSVCLGLYSLCNYFIALVYIIVKLNIKRLKAQNIKLEGIITQRTATIEEQKIIVELKHKEITDSINYAERIQRSMLASKKLLSENLNTRANKDSYFILFKPKDIVSGDFIGQVNCKIINFVWLRRIAPAMGFLALL